ncbi:hypothetical protein I8748_20540 [Nostoc sp. CENA67]|uniref:Uncharacterized protein n=1 Tax=Amazonocrinis nigriterrae CENA67 TaxID=2794033 RepID=A0A8J7HWF7_9NOST|nr:hypothetical protein [Amazonocrinis nigriterrae]MBH8564542.1 hypothetical protein [Amazonocrinis nigriterrae CENA67]
MAGQMCWLPTKGSNGELILHLRTAPSQPWQPYRSRMEAVPDYDIPHGSKGWATYQKLRQLGWTLIPTAQAKTITFAQKLKTA